ncbi:MAG: xanthine dehydrogenase family protein molybdopterin-binding subunit [Deltaproteobacteria bacterium]|nr:xanthine dehydrogenase family protein molybdopterin-binding subunit [Deltaproteobacteria bacterium]
MTTLSRRGFLTAAGTGAAALVIGFHIPEGAARTVAPAPKAMMSPNAFLRIGSDESITVVIAHSEMGQGIWTGLAMLVAEELACDWTRIRCEHAPADAATYAAPGSPLQMTGGSSTTRGEYQRYREVGATAKDMLIRAAAARWKVAPADCVAENGAVVGKRGQRATFGQLAAEAMKLPPPASVKLKDPKDWKILGTPVRRLDSPEKVTGRATFGMDVQFPGLRTALVARPPAFGAMLVKFDAAAALKVPGVEKVVPAGNGVAVVAAHFWAAKLGRDALVVEWSQPEGGGLDTARFSAQLRKLVEAHGTDVGKEGSVDAGKVAATLTSVYEVPYLAHAPMEPLNCAVKINADGTCDIYTGTQAPSLDQQVAGGILGIAPDKVRVHTQFLGGGFGRRANPKQDFVAEAVLVAKAAGVPVKTVWTREDDIRGGFYRPAYAHRIVAKTDRAGAPIGWEHVVAGQSIMKGTPFEAFVVRNGVDPTSVEGLAESPYLRGAARHVSLHTPVTPVTVLWWRSVGNTHTAFAMECMIDELAHAAKADPLAYRLKLLDGAPRHAAVLKLAADKGGWGTPPPAGRARGLAVHESFGSIVAQCAEVSVEGDRIRVHHVACAVDCGPAVNPLGIEAQVHSSVVYGLTAALHGKLDLAGGAVQQGNFHDYPVLRMFEMPSVSVHVVPSTARMGGIGEPATAPIAPAVANAVYALTKQRLRALPLRLATVREARG